MGNSVLLRTELILIFIAIFGFCQVFAQQDKVEVVVDGSIHSADEIMVMMIDSKVRYSLMTGEADSIPVDTSGPQVLPAGIFLGENYEFQIHTLPDSLESDFQKAEELYLSKKYLEAALAYKSVLERCSHFNYLMTFIGDSYVVAGHFDSAIVYLEKSIDSNFIDYQAHWYLANAFAHTDRYEEALQQMHLAHLLNPNHELLNGNLVNRRAENDLPPMSRAFEPKYDLRQSGDEILIRFDPMWLQYSLVKAIWFAEPGYRDKMVAELIHPVEAIILEEKEAVFSHLSREARRELRARLIEDDLYDEFVIYEFLAYESPEIMLYLSPDFLNRIADYLLVRHEYLALLPN